VRKYQSTTFLIYRAGPKVLLPPTKLHSIGASELNYAMSQKMMTNTIPYLLPNIQNSLTGTLSRKFAIKLSLKMTRHLEHVATLLVKC